MTIYYDRNKGVKLLLSIIYPFGAFICSWKDLKSRSTYIVFFIFFIVYGLSFTVNTESADSFRYVEDFNAFSSNASHNFSAVIHDYFSKDSEEKDIFVYVLYYLTNILVGKNYHVFFCLVAIVFGYFYLRSFRLITSDESYRNAPFYLILAIIFTFSNPISNINGVRFWTAAWIAVFMTFEVLLNKKRKYLFLLPVLPLVHGSFYVYIFFFIIAYYIRHFYKVLPYLFFISFFITDIALKVLPEVTDYFPTFLQDMVWSYTVSDYALSRMSGEVASQEALYARVLMAIPRYFHIIMIFLLVRSQKYFRDDQSKEFLGFLLGVGILINISSMIPSMGRYWYLLIPFYVYLWVHNGRVMFQYKKILYLYPLIALYPAFRGFRFAYWNTDPLLYVTNTFHIIIHNLLQ